MLRFTPEQQTAVIGARRAFNARMTALATASAASMLEGNSLAIPLDAWRRIDSRAQALARTRLQVFNRLAKASTIPVSIGDVVNYYPQMGDSGDVLVSMDGRNTAKADGPAMKFVGTPVPIFTANTRMGWRQMEVLRKAGGGAMLDTASVANDQRKVAEKLEDMVINGLPSIVVGGDTIYGLRTLPTRTTFTHGFTLASATGANWVTAFRQLINAAIGDNQFGRITVFLNIGDYTAADLTDYAAGYTGTILERLRAISQVVEIVPASSVPANEILGIVDLDAGAWGGILSAMPLTTRPKTRIEPEDDYVFGVITACAPQFRADYNGQSAFVHGTTA